VTKPPLCALAGAVACAILASSAQAATDCVPAAIRRSGEIPKAGVQGVMAAPVLPSIAVDIPKSTHRK
jgi:hypothetical protein